MFIGSTKSTFPAWFPSRNKNHERLLQLQELLPTSFEGCSALGAVRFTPKADIRGATMDVRFGPKADIRRRVSGWRAALAARHSVRIAYLTVMVIFSETTGGLNG